MNGPTKLERRFHEAMLDIYERAKKECRYNATRFRQMVIDRGGLQAARALLHAPTVSDGFAALWECGKLELTVEALVLSPEFRGLFTDDELEIARRRLEAFGFDVVGGEMQG